MTKHFLSRDQDRPVRGHCLNDVKIQTTDLTATGVMKMEIRGLLKAYPEAAKREILNTLLSEFSASSTQTLYNKVPDGLPPPAINNGVKQESPVWTGPPGSV